MSLWDRFKNLGRPVKAEEQGPPFAQAFQQALEGVKPGWKLAPHGITGPDDALIRFVQLHHSESPGHVDVEFLLNEKAAAPVVLGDCVSGFGATPEEWANSAARIWVQTTGMAFLELAYSRRGEFADHYHAQDAGGLTGWHSICGGHLGYGVGESGSLLQQWWLEHGLVLPAIAQALADLPDAGAPYGIKILFGASDIAEVRVNGEAHEAASEALRELDWPRLEQPGFLRTFVIAIHREWRCSNRVSADTSATSSRLNDLWHLLPGESSCVGHLLGSIWERRCRSWKTFGCALLGWGKVEGEHTGASRQQAARSPRRRSRGMGAPVGGASRRSVPRIRPAGTAQPVPLQNRVRARCRKA